MKVTVEEARRLFDEDSGLSVFRGSCDAQKRWVNLYPRKRASGFVYCIWGPGVATIGTMAIVGGGVTDSRPLVGAAQEAGALVDAAQEAGALVDAAQEAVAALFEHVREVLKDG